MRIPSYPSVLALGHRGLVGLLTGPVRLEEKVDGSQISFGLIATGADTYELAIRSRGKDQYPDTDRMFTLARERIEACDLQPDWVYRGEYLSKPKHNTLAYDRVPDGNIVIFDIEDAAGYILGTTARAIEAARLGFEIAPVIFEGVLDQAQLMNLIQSSLERISLLGGARIEGIVVKNPEIFGQDHKWLAGKFVSEAFKEIHQGDWKNRNPGQNDFVATLAAKYNTQARWQKAVQHAAEAGVLQGEPRDIGLLVQLVKDDVELECGADIRDALFSHHWRAIGKGITNGLPEWYKQKLADEAVYAPVGAKLISTGRLGEGDSETDEQFAASLERLKAQPWYTELVPA
jgi:hypothetical protein